MESLSFNNWKQGKIALKARIQILSASIPNDVHLGKSLPTAWNYHVPLSEEWGYLKNLHKQ